MRLRGGGLCLLGLLVVGACGRASDDRAEDSGTESQGAQGRGDGESRPCDADVDCDDGEHCNGAETCVRGLCIAATAIDCDDGIDCTTDWCSDERAACVNEAPDVDGDGHADVWCVDGDGNPLGSDCDDEDPGRFPTNPEVCDSEGIDEDCLSYTLGGGDDRDRDGDGFVGVACCNRQGDDELLCGTDCDDTKMGVNPGTPESCNDEDDDCDGVVDEDSQTRCYEDADGDDYALQDAVTMDLCGVCPNGWTEREPIGGGDDDCNDLDNSIHPGVTDFCDGLDNDCDGSADEHLGVGGCCGDGKLNGNEICDDNNSVDDDFCSSTCRRASDLSLGAFHGCVVRVDDSVECWGRETIYDPDLDPGHPLRDVPDGRYIDVDGGYVHTCAVTETGRVACFGASTADDPTPEGERHNWGQAQPPAGTFGQISTGKYVTCGVRLYGALECWGKNHAGQRDPPAGNDFRQVDCGDGYCCAVRVDDSIACWGGDPDLNDPDDELLPKVSGAPGGGYFLEVATSYDTAYALTTDGELRWWGEPIGTRCEGFVPLPGPEERFVRLSAGYRHACAMRDDGTIACWGCNGDGRAAPPNATFATIEAGGWWTSCGVRTDGRVECWGGVGYDLIPPPEP